MAEKPISLADGLSTEEVKIFEHILSTNVCPADDESLSIPLCLSDQDYRQEINQLEASKKRYAVQTNALRVQKDLFRNLSKHNSTTSPSMARILSQNALGEVQYIQSLNDDQLSSIKHRLYSISSTLTSLSKSASPLISERLRAHDKTISTLSMPDKSESITDIDSKYMFDHSRVDLLAKALIKLRSQALRDHLDRTYLKALQEQPQTTSSSAEASVAQIQSLETDIQSLYVEIEDVLSMLVSQQHLAPLKSAVQQIKVAEQRNQNNQLTNIIFTLQSLASELSLLERHITSTRSSQIVLQQLFKYLSQINGNVHDRLHSAEDHANTALGSPETEIAAKRFLDHVGGTPGNETGESAKAGFFDLLSMLNEAALTRAVAVATLKASPDSSNEASVQLTELEQRIEEARQDLAKQSS